MSPEAKTDFSVAKAVWKKVAEETKNLNVLIPFDYNWGAESSRRLQPFFLAMMYTVAKANYKRRLIVGDSLFATPRGLLYNEIRLQLLPPNNGHSNVG